MPVPTCSLPPSEGPSPLCRALHWRGKTGCLLFHQLPHPWYPGWHSAPQGVQVPHRAIVHIFSWEISGFLLDSVPGLRGSLPSTLFPLPIEESPPPHLCYSPLQAMGSLVPPSTVANITATGFWERKRFIARSTDKDMGGSSSSNLPPSLGFSQALWVRAGGFVWRCWSAGFDWGLWGLVTMSGQWRSSGHWLRSLPDLVSSSLLKASGVRFRSHWGPLVPWGRTWFQMLSEVRRFFLLLWLRDDVCSDVSEEQLSILLETGSGQFGLVLQLHTHFFSFLF